MSANNKLRFDGLSELREQLRNLPSDLAGEASNIVEGAANGAASEIKQAYPQGETGNLIRGVVVTHADAGKFAAGAIVKNTAKHAAMFENGTQARHTDIGANRGAMPPGHVFIPIVVRKRRVMYDKLKAMLVRNGLTVVGEA